MVSLADAEAVVRLYATLLNFNVVDRGQFGEKIPRLCSFVNPHAMGSLAYTLD